MARHSETNDLLRELIGEVRALREMYYAANTPGNVQIHFGDARAMAADEVAAHLAARSQQEVWS